MDFNYIINGLLATLFFLIVKQNNGLPNYDKIPYYNEFATAYLFLDDFLTKFNDIIYPKCLYLDDTEREHKDKETEDKDEEKDEEKEMEDKENTKKEVKYEEKYLDDIRKLNKNFILTEEDEALENQKYKEYYDSLIKNYNKDIAVKLEEIKKFEFKRYELISMTDEEYYDESQDELQDKYKEYVREDLITNITTEINNKKEQLSLLESKINNKQELETQSKEYANDFVITKKKENLEGCYVMEHTPLGNVLMIYDFKRDTFSYYSDSTIPYRYLEVVGRKYVKFFNCRPIFIDMEEELKLYEEKMKNEIEEKERNERLKQELQDTNNSIAEPKKNVFAQFKSYNKDAGSGRVNKVPPPKNSIPNKNPTGNSKTNDGILLKDRANRYTYEGKMSNFNFIKKINKTAVNKKYALTFADFKKMQLTNKK